MRLSSPQATSCCCTWVCRLVNLLLTPIPVAPPHMLQVVFSARGRGKQMNAGAQAARGDVLLFLHADSQLPEGYHEAMQRAWSGAAAQAAGRQIPRCVQTWMNRGMCTDEGGAEAAKIHSE